jgi:mono/diheme cytochrome c family protein
MKRRYAGTTAALALAAASLTTAAWLSTAEAAKEKAAAKDDKVSVERGRYLAKIAGCNDCHTPNYAMSGGTTPESEWLVGDHLGWKGDWGTTYPANLRLSLGKLTEDQWVHLAKTAQFRPPMPWFALRDMSEEDLRSFHRFVRSLGAPGQPAPAYLPPGVEAKGPVISFPEPPAPAPKAAGPKSASR